MVRTAGSALVLTRQLLHVTVMLACRYSKRVSLSGVYAATEVYMLSDYSPGLADTWQSLDRRLEDVMRLGKLASQARCPLPACVACWLLLELQCWCHARIV